MLELSHHHIITSSHHHIITSSHYHIITLSHYHIITLSHYHIITLSHYHIFPYFAPTNQPFLPMNKHIVYIILLFSVNLVYAQHRPPQGITHKAVIRDSHNQPVVNSPVGVRISILVDSLEGEAFYVEMHTPVSNHSGLITYVIGQGAVVSGGGMMPMRRFFGGGSLF